MTQTTTYRNLAVAMVIASATLVAACSDDATDGRTEDTGPGADDTIEYEPRDTADEIDATDTASPEDIERDSSRLEDTTSIEDTTSDTSADSVSDTFHRDTSARDTSARDTSAPDTSAPDTSALDTSARDTSPPSPDTAADSGASDTSDRTDTADGSSADSESCPPPKNYSGFCTQVQVCCEHRGTGQTCTYGNPCEVPDELEQNSDWSCDSSNC